MLGYDQGDPDSNPSSTISTGIDSPSRRRVDHTHRHTLQSRLRSWKRQNIMDSLAPLHLCINESSSVVQSSLQQDEGILLAVLILINRPGWGTDQEEHSVYGSSAVREYKVTESIHYLKG